MPPIKGERFWTPVTSTIDWCEANYEVTIYVVEFWNTVSSIVGLFLPPFLGLTFGLAKRKINIPILKVCWVLLAIVGLGSSCFHGTLKYQMQLFDEVPMLVLTLTLLYWQLSIIYKNRGKKKQILFLSVYFFISIGFYVSHKTPIIFQALFILPLLSNLVLNFVISKVKKINQNSAETILLLIFSGFVFWLIDYNACQTLIRVRSKLTKFLGCLTQFHAIWHLLAGMTTVKIINYCSINTVSF